MRPIIVAVVAMTVVVASVTEIPVITVAMTVVVASATEIPVITASIKLKKTKPRTGQFQNSRQNSLTK